MKRVLWMVVVMEWNVDADLVRIQLRLMQVISELLILTAVL